MIKVITTIMCLIALVCQVQAQSFTWGEPVKHEKVEFSENSVIERFVLSETQEGVKRLRVEKTELIGNATITLETYDVNLVLQKTKTVFSGSMEAQQYEEIVIGADKFYVFTVLNDAKAKTNSLMVLTYDFDGEPVGEAKELDVLKNVKPLSPGEFIIAGSENGQHFASIGVPPFQKKTMETIQVKTYDTNLNEVFGESIELKHERKRFVFDVPFITNDGILYLEKNIKVKGQGRVYEVYTLDAASKKLNGEVINLNATTTVESSNNLMLETTNGNLAYAGLQKNNKGLKAAKGIFYLEYDKAGKVVRKVVADLPDAPKYGFTGLTFKKAEVVGNDVYLFADMNGRTIGAGSNPQNPSYIYTAGNLYVIKIEGDKVAWTTIIERSEITQNGAKGAMIDWMWNIDNDGNVVVFCNDLLRKYDKSVGEVANLIPLQVVISSNGESKKKPLIGVKLGKYGDTYGFCPNESYQRDGYLIVKCTNSIDFKLGRLKY